MLNILRLGHYALKVSDVERSTRFYRDIVGLHEREHGTHGEVYFQRGTDHHCLVLYPTDFIDPVDHKLPDAPVLHHIAWEVASETELQQAGEYLQQNGCTLLAGPQTQPGPGRHTSLRFRDPSGIPHELFCDMEQAEEDTRDRPFRLQKLGHVAVGTKDMQASVKFATEVLGFRISDWVGDFLCFTRCNQDHHALPFIGNGLSNLHHTGYEATDFEDIKLFADNACRNDVLLIWGPGRHPPGETLFAYVRDPDQNIVEVFAEQVLIFDEEKWKVQEFEPGPRSVDYWGNPPPSEDFIRGPGWSF
jgi:2,3-dihydroxy-p-cumate/2,3-dihydroxybenzoate 3,4-dioxygenase